MVEILVNLEIKCSECDKLLGTYNGEVFWIIMDGAYRIGAFLVLCEHCRDELKRVKEKGS